MKRHEPTTVITSKKPLFDLQLKQLWDYKDLLILFIKRDIVIVYKQTVLGPLWYLIQPVLTTLMFTFVFGKLAKISTDGIPHILFYLLGVTIWSYFSECLTKTSNTFISNQGIFGKVYFPRMIIPLSVVISNLGKLSIQLIIFLCVWGYYLSTASISPQYQYIFLLPVIIAIMGITSLGFGMLFSSMTTKYRDLTFLLSFAIQLWMYVTPVIYPLSAIPTEYLKIVKLNPIAPLVESMRFGFLGKGLFSFDDLIYSAVFSIVIFIVGLAVFNRVEKNFMDTV